ncbi:MAG TPA: hypothetical protein VGG45_13340 [Terracidiphilus sp.]|jgi:hypothetical protein
MKHFGRVLFTLFIATFFLSTVARSQALGANILSPSRVIDWGKAGLPATLPDGETTANPWTPPTRPACTSAQAGITVPVPSGTSFSSIVTAMNNCSAANPSGSYLLLGSGSFTIGSVAELNTAPYVTLRGSGPMSTTITLSASLQFGQGANSNGAALGSIPAQGANSLTLTGVSGSAPVTGNLAWFNQCNTGFSGSIQAGAGYNNCTSGSYADNGGLYICGRSTTCSLYSGTANPADQVQYVSITSVSNNGGGSYTIGFSPSLYMPNWSTSNTAAMYWEGKSGIGYGIGLEDMSIVFSNGANAEVSGPAYGCWIKGVRFVGAPANVQVSAFGRGAHNLISNSYFFSMTPSSPTSAVSGVFNASDSDSLLLNNIEDYATFIEGGGSQSGEVVAYNSIHNNNNAGPFPSVTYQHDNSGAGVNFILLEGNQGDGWDDDDTWGTGDLNTTFRNWFACSSAPFAYSSAAGIGIAVDAFHRFDSAIANVLGGTAQCTTYSGSGNGAIYRFASSGTDPLAAATFMRWLNYDTVTGAVQKNPLEVPTGLSGNALAFANILPNVNLTAPASFFMDSMGFYPSGGTGLSWWKVCNSGFSPSSGICAGTTTAPPFPTCGPDVTGGNEVNGHCYDNPASIAYKTLPVDTTYQNSYSITASTWSNVSSTCAPAPAPCEILTVSGLPSSGNRLMGPMQISGGSCATTGASTATGSEVYMTHATSTTVTYSLASNPGACTGTMLWPDVRQFDERVYEADSGSSTRGGTGPNPPTGLAGSTQTIP